MIAFLFFSLFTWLLSRSPNQLSAYIYIADNNIDFILKPTRCTKTKKYFDNK